MRKTNIDDIILKALLDAAPNPISGSILAQMTAVSKVSVWMHIDKLKKEGFQIEGVRNQGYWLKGEPNTVHPALIRIHMEKLPIKAGFYYYDRIDSSNNEVERLLLKGTHTPFVVLSPQQTACRGRLGRNWYWKDPGNLLLSFGSKPKLPVQRMQKFTLWMGLCFCRLLNEQYDLPVQIKWPNDLVYDGKKIGGILAESHIEVDQVRDLTFGIGLNVNSQIEKWPSAIRNVATSLHKIAKIPLNINQMAAQVIHAGIRGCETFFSGGYEDTFKREWKKYHSLIGKIVSVRTEQKLFHGTIMGIDDCGALILKENGKKIILHSGDVTLQSTQ